MAYDYSDDIVFVQDELAEYGRQITLINTASAAAGANAFEGSADLDTPDATLGPLFAVSVPPASREEFGLSTVTEEMVAMVREILLVSPGADFDVEPYKELDDNGKRYKIAWAETFRPGSDTLFAFLGVAR